MKPKHPAHECTKQQRKAWNLIAQGVQDGHDLRVIKSLLKKELIYQRATIDLGKCMVEEAWLEVPGYLFREYLEWCKS